MGPEYSARLVIRREGDSFQARWVESDGWGHALFEAVFGTTEGTHVYRNLREAVDARRRVMGNCRRRRHRRF